MNEIVREWSLKERKKIIPESLIEMDVSFDVGKSEKRVLKTNVVDCIIFLWLL